jgi:hypothetical protein
MDNGRTFGPSGLGSLFLDHCEPFTCERAQQGHVAGMEIQFGSNSNHESMECQFNHAFPGRLGRDPKNLPVGSAGLSNFD